MNNNRVSVLMTVYNDGNRLLNEAIESILNQTYQKFQFVIVNDGSTDNSSKIIEGYASNDSRILYINRNENAGRIFSLNEGLKACNGDFIFINDADDISFSKRIESSLEYYKNKINVKEKFGLLAAACEFNYIEEKKKVKKYIKSGNIFSDKIYTWRLLLGMPYVHSSIMYNKNVLIAIGGFPNEVINSEDYFASIKISNSFDIYGINELLVQRSIDGSNFFMKNQKKDFIDFNLKVINEWNRKNIKFYSIKNIPKKIYTFFK